MQQNEPLDLSCTTNSRSTISQDLKEDLIRSLEKQSICDSIRSINSVRPDISKNKFLGALELKPVSLKEDTHDVPLFGYAVNDGFLRASRLRPYASIYWSILAHHNLLPQKEGKGRESNGSKVDDLPLDLSVKKGKLEVVSNSSAVVKLAVKQKQKRYRTEKPFECTHCAARFTLRSNMIRHRKQQHPFLRRRRDCRKLRNGLTEFSKEQIDPACDWPPELSLDECGGTPFPMPKSYYFKGQDDDEDDSYGEFFATLSTSSASKKKSAYSTAPNRVSCPYCSREFPWNSSLRRHILTHTGQKPYKCDSCPLLFTTKSNCDRHTSRKHAATQGIDCNKGSESSDITSEADSSQDTQDEIPGSFEAPFKCHLCDSAFRDRQGALDHLKQKHSGDYASLLPKLTAAVPTGVDSSSDTPDEIIRDPATVNWPRTVCNNRKVICALCQRRFWSTEDLRRHMRTHTGERPFSCELCSRRFTLKHSMLRHLKKHRSGLKK